MALMLISAFSLPDPTLNPDAPKRACSQVRLCLKATKRLLSPEQKSSLTSRRGAASPLISWAAYPSRRLGPRAAGEMPRLDSNPCALGRASPLSGLCLYNRYPHASSR